MALSLSGSRATLVGTQTFSTPAESAFALLCEVEKWPVWLSFLKTARFVEEGATLGLGTEIAIRGSIPGEPEELYEVDQFMHGYIVSLVGAYSTRRRIDFRIESKLESSKLAVRVDYPAYGGSLGALIDRMTARRRLDRALGDSLVHFKGLVEFQSAPDQLLADF
jgi:uncharacterized membrane protein